MSPAVAVMAIMDVQHGTLSIKHPCFMTYSEWAASDLAVYWQVSDCYYIITPYESIKTTFTVE